MAASLLFADVSYQESVRYTGGTILEVVRGLSGGIMGKMGGGRLAQAFSDETYTVSLKGNKMSRVGTKTSMIYDLDAGTITIIDHQRRTYNTATFAEMKKNMDDANQRMSKQNPNIQFDAKVDATGNIRQIDGQPAKEYILTVTAQGQEQGQQGGISIRSDLWAVADEPGAAELRAFWVHLSQKGFDTFGGNPMMGGANKGMSEMFHQLSKLDGIPVLNDTAMHGVQSPLAAMGGNNDPNAPFLTMETTSKNFSTNAVSDDSFQIPAGYKEERRRH